MLGQQGWHIHDGRLEIGDRAFDSAGVLTPTGRDARVATLHPSVRQVVTRYLDSGLLDAAIFEAVKVVNSRIRELSGLDLDGAPLMTQALSEQSPAVTVADLSTETGRNVQTGYRHFFMGVARVFRKPGAHEPFEDITMESGAGAPGLLVDADAQTRRRSRPCRSAGTVIAELLGDR